MKTRKNIKIQIPVRYLPRDLSKTDKKKQIHMLQLSRKKYKKHQYYNRKSVSSYTSKPSKHVKNAQKIYQIDHIIPNKELAEKTGCDLSALRKIVKKGEGAYYSSGSRPNQTAQSWGLARLASAITSGKAAAVDYDILLNGCDHNKPAFLLAKKSKRKYGFGHSKTRKVPI
jgi:hypothetical protein